MSAGNLLAKQLDMNSHPTAAHGTLLLEVETVLVHRFSHRVELPYRLNFTSNAKPPGRASRPKEKRGVVEIEPGSCVRSRIQDLLEVRLICRFEI